MTTTLLPVFAALAAKFGHALASNIWANLSGSTLSARAPQIKSLLDAGASIVEAAGQVLGSDFSTAFYKATTSTRSTWNYRAGVHDYVRTSIDPTDDRQAVRDLREELDLNLGRIEFACKELGSDESLNYLWGGIDAWARRYGERFPLDAAERLELEKALGALRGESSWKTRFASLGATASFGLAAISLHRACLLMFSVGVGVLVAFRSWLFGVPFLWVALHLVGSGALFQTGRWLRGTCTPTERASTLIAKLYEILERKHFKTN